MCLLHSFQFIVMRLLLVPLFSSLFNILLLVITRHILVNLAYVSAIITVTLLLHEVILFAEY